jgi:hypothetical protein
VLGFWIIISKVIGNLEKYGRNIKCYLFQRLSLARPMVSYLIQLFHGDPRIGFGVIASIALIDQVNAQENNYWSVHQSTEAALTGGAVISSDYDQSAAFYNPGILQFIKVSSLGANSNTYLYRDLQLNNGAGEGLDLIDRNLEAIPTQVYGIIKSEKKPWLTTSYSILSRRNSRIRFGYLNQQEFQDTNLADPANYAGGVQYENTLREYWAGLSKGWKVGERFGIGISTFFVVNTMDYARSSETGITETASSSFRTIASTSISDYLSYSSLGLLWKIGFTYKEPNHSIGLTLTTPMLNINFLGKATLSRLIFVTSDDFFFSNPKYLSYTENIRTRTIKPWVVDFGASKKFGATELSIRLAYYSQVNPYGMLFSEDIPSEGLFDPSTNLGLPGMAHKAITNFGLGVRQTVDERLDLLFGFNTDFNYLDTKALDQTDYVVPSIATWDINTISGGASFLLKSALVSAGLSYRWSREYDQTQLINLTNPEIDNFLYGETTNTTSVLLNSIGINFGVSFSLAYK